MSPIVITIGRSINRAHQLLPKEKALFSALDSHRNEISTEEMRSWAGDRGRTYRADYPAPADPIAKKVVYVCTAPSESSRLPKPPLYNELLLSIADHLEPRDLNLLILAGSRHLSALLTRYLHQLAGHYPYEPGALFWAAASGNTHVANLLLNVARDITVEEALDETVVYYREPGKSSNDSLRFVFEGGQFFFYDLDIEGKGFHWAVQNRHYALARLMLDEEKCGVEADVEIAYDPIPDHPLIPLLYSCSTGDIKMVDILISAGASVSIKDRRNHRTPLHIAAAAGHADIVKLLLENGASLERDVMGLTPIDYAAHHRNRHISQLLLDRVAYSFTDTSRRNILQLAIIHNHPSLVYQLLSCPRAVAGGYRDVNKMTALHYAARSGNSSFVEILIDKGADINAFDRLRRTPLHLAAQYGHGAMGALLARGADMWKRDRYGRTPLHLVCRTQSDLVRSMVERGADVGAVDKFGRTPLHVCGQWGNREGWGILVEAGAKDGQRDWKKRCAGWWVEKERVGRGRKEGW